MKNTTRVLEWRRFFAIAAVLMGALGGDVALGRAQAADLKLMVEPFYTPEQAADVYQPLIDYLGTATGHRVTLVTPRNYHFFWRDMRQDIAVDLVLAEPPMTDYRIQRFGAVPLVRTAEPTRYALVVSVDFPEPSLQALYGRDIVTMPSPSLGFALLLEFFPDLVRQPNILSSAASWRDGVEIVSAGEADATIIPTWLQSQYPNLVPVRVSREFPGIAVSAARTLDAQVADDIRSALLRLHDDPAAYEVLFELGITRFETTRAADYAGAQLMLREFYGYQ